MKDRDILARGELLRMIGDNHLLEEGALVLQQFLFGYHKLSATYLKKEKKIRKGKEKDEKNKNKRRKEIKLVRRGGGGVMMWEKLKEGEEEDVY